MVRPKEYKTITLDPSKLLIDSERVLIRPLYIKAPIRRQNHGGARISISDEFADYEAIIFVTNKKVIEK